jgi:hypothetical protein
MAASGAARSTRPSGSPMLVTPTTFIPSSNPLTTQRKNQTHKIRTITGAVQDDTRKPNKNWTANKKRRVPEEQKVTTKSDFQQSKKKSNKTTI